MAAASTDLVETKSDVVTVKPEGVELEVEEVLLKSGSDRRLVGCSNEQGRRSSVWAERTNERRTSNAPFRKPRDQ
jgi:hypothetical protein